MQIVDLSRSVAGAFCARLLALRGDQVIAVDTLPQRDTLEADTDWTETYLRFGVESLPGDAAGVAELLRAADVVLTGWDGGKPNHDIDITALNREAVEVVVSSFGSYGPYAGFSGSPLIDWASGGYLYITGLPEREPLQGPELLPAYVTGYVAASAVEVGLRLRQPGHPGPRLDVATMEVMASAHQTTFSNFAAWGEIRKRREHAQPLHPLDIIECSDGWVSIAVVTEAHYDILAGVVGEPNLVIDPRFATGQSRHEHAHAFDALVRPWFMAHTVDQVVELLQHHHVPAVKLVDQVSILPDPQLRHRGFWLEWRDGSRRGVMAGDPIQVTRGSSPALPPPVPAGPDDGRRLPLTGTLVVDLTNYWAGPMATRILADLGATVVRVERPGSRPADHAARPYIDWKMNRGKYSLSLDLSTDAGRAVLGDLAQRADVFVENSRPGSVQRLGFGYDVVAKTNPGIVYLSLSGFGQDGPRSSWASFGPVVEAGSSIQARTRYSDSIPLLLGHSLPDPVGGFVGVFAALNGLRVRSSTNRGAWIDISQLECYAALCAEEILQASVTGSVPSELPKPQRIFRCCGDDAWVAIEATTEQAIATVSRALGSPNSIEAVAAAVALRDKFEVARIVQAQGVPAFPVVDVSDLATDRHLVERGFMIDVNNGSKTARMPSLPIHGRPEIAHIAAASPACGEHSEYVMRVILGYGPQRIDELLSSGAVAQAKPNN